MTRKIKTEAPLTRSGAGFTLVEMIAVLIIVGLVSSIGFARYGKPDRYEQRGFADHTLTAMRYAHRLAMTTECDVRIQLTSTELVVSHWSDCTPLLHTTSTTPFENADYQGDFSQNVPGGMTIDQFDLFFDREGRPYERNTALLLTTAKQITLGYFSVELEQQTGFSYLL